MIASDTTITQLTVSTTVTRGRLRKVAWRRRCWGASVTSHSARRQPRCYWRRRLLVAWHRGVLNQQDCQYRRGRQWHRLGLLIVYLNQLHTRTQWNRLSVQLQYLHQRRQRHSHHYHHQQQQHVQLAALRVQCHWQPTVCSWLN